MSSKKQIEAAQKNIKKAQAVWKAMTPRQHAIAQPQGASRKKPGSTGRGSFYRIEVRPKNQFVSFKTHDVGEAGKLERVAGRRPSGSWATVTWLINKDSARVTDTRDLIITDPGVKTVLRSIQEPITYVRGDIFKAKPRKNIPEKDKPTTAQKQAWAQNIKKAQQARAQRRAV
jgi:hypothetical protein